MIRYMTLQTELHGFWLCGSCDKAITVEEQSRKGEWIIKKVDHPDMPSPARLPICPDCFLKALEIPWDRTSIYTDDNGNGDPTQDNWFLAYEPILDKASE